MAAFALGLIGDALGTPGTAQRPSGTATRLCRDGVPKPWGRLAISQRCRRHCDHGEGPRPERGADGTSRRTTWREPLAPPVESARLGLHALVRLGSFDAIMRRQCSTRAAPPVSTWWPLAYALGRAGDARAAPALVLRCLPPPAA